MLAHVVAGQGADPLAQGRVGEQPVEEGHELVLLGRPRIDRDDHALRELVARGRARGDEHRPAHPQGADEGARDLAVGGEAQAQDHVGRAEVAHEVGQAQAPGQEQAIRHAGHGREIAQGQRRILIAGDHQAGARGSARAAGPPRARPTSSPLVAVARPGAVTSSASSGRPRARRASARDGSGWRGSDRWWGRCSTGRPGRRRAARRAHERG